MQAMLLRQIGTIHEGRPPLEPANLPIPEPREDEVLIRVRACGVCHTELDEIEGRTPPSRLPVIPGHQAVGTIVEGRLTGQRVGVAWIHSACGECAYCTSGQENLCSRFRATGRDADGGYAEYITVPLSFAIPIPDELTDLEAAPLLCAGAVGFRALRLSGISDGATLGLFGFGASNHLVLKTARHLYPNSPILVFTRNAEERRLATELGAVWSGAIADTPPQLLDAAIDATPAWLPVVQALGLLVSGGRLVINAIRKKDDDKDELQRLDFGRHLWMEREIKSVANVTRAEVQAFLQLAAEAGIRPELEEYALADANLAVLDIAKGRIRGAKVLRIE